MMESSYVRRFTELQVAWAANGKGSAPVPISIRQMIAKEFWEAETSERRAKFTAEALEEHRVALAEWTSGKKIPTSPKQWHEYDHFHLNS